jgi:DNA-binding MurR/RpiR family transcriptional regulator
MIEPLAEKLREDFPKLTKSEKAVASYMLSHLQRLPFETAASIAEAVGVSQMTVSRFLRTLGYKGLSDLKERLRADMEGGAQVPVRRSSSRASRRSAASPRISPDGSTTCDRTPISCTARAAPSASFLPGRATTSC